MLPTFIQIIDLTEQEESEYWMVVSAVFEGREILPPQSSDYSQRSSLDSYTSGPVDSGINNKVSMQGTHLHRNNKQELQHHGY